MNLVGFVNALLVSIATMAGLNDPQLKVTPTGFLQMLLESGAKVQVANAAALQSGQDKEIKVRYMQRGIASDVDEEDNCDAPITAIWKESIVTRPLFSKMGIFISDDTMRKLQDESTALQVAGNADAPMFRALYETMLVKLNGLIQKIDLNLLTAQSTQWGANVAYGDNAGHTINFGKELVMDDGIVKLLLDAQANEIGGKLLLAGNGIVNAYGLLNNLKVGLDQFGYGKQDFGIYNDINSVSVWGANHFGAFAPGLIGFVDFNKNVGNYKGVRDGAAFFSIPIPVVLANGVLSNLKIDAQLQYEKCPIYDEGHIKIADRGWKLLLSKSYGLWNAPNDMFAEADRLAGFNGSLHYIGAVSA